MVYFEQEKADHRTIGKYSFIQYAVLQPGAANLSYSFIQYAVLQPGPCSQSVSKLPVDEKNPNIIVKLGNLTNYSLVLRPKLCAFRNLTSYSLVLRPKLCAFR